MKTTKFSKWELVHNRCNCGGDIVVSKKMHRNIIVECVKCGLYMIIIEPIEHFLARG